MIPTIHDTSLGMLGVLDTASGITYNLVLNDLSTGAFTLAGEDPQNVNCVPGNFVHMYDGDSDLGWWRINGMTSGSCMPGGTNVYSLESACATLVDDLIEINAGEDATWENYPLGYILEQLLAMQSVTRWALGTCDFSATVIDEFEPGNSTVLAGIKALAEKLQDVDYQLVFDTTSTPWTLSLVEMGDDPDCGIHYGRNLVDIEKSMDCTTLVTRLYLQGATKRGKPLDVTSVNDDLSYIDADTIDTYGVRCGIWVDEYQKDAAALLADGQRILAMYCEPYVTYTVSAVDLSGMTGYAWDTFRPGKLVRVMDDEHGQLFTARVQNVEKQDMRGAPWDVTITLANKARDAVDTLNRLKDKASKAGRAASAAKETSEENADELHKHWTEITKTNELIKLKASAHDVSELTGRVTDAEASITTMADKITLLVKQTDELDGEIDNAKAQLVIQDNSIGSLVQSRDSQEGQITEMQSSIQQYAGEIALCVKSADLNSSISLTGSGVTISGGTITLTASTLVAALEAEIKGLWTDDLFSTNISATGMSATNADFEHLTAGDATFFTWGQGNTFGLYTLSIGGKTCSFYGTADATFNLSDMPGYADAVAAARTEGRRSVTISDEHIELESYSYTGGKAAYATIRATASNSATNTATLRLDVTDVYEAGQAAGGGGKTGASVLNIDDVEITTSTVHTYYTYNTKACQVYTIAAGCQLGIRSPSGTFTSLLNNSTTENMWVSHGSTYVEKSGQSKPSETMVTGRVEHTIFYVPFSNP